MCRSAMQGDLVVEYCGRSTFDLVMPERTHAGKDPHPFEPLGPGVASRMFIIPAANGKTNPVPGRHSDAGRPDFDIELVNFTRHKALDLVMGMIRAIIQRSFKVQLTVRRPQPAERNRRMGVIRALESHLFHVGRENPDDEKEIGVFR